MEIYNKLPESVQWYVNKMYMTSFVLNEIKNHERHEVCANCLYHGFPCLNCANYIYNGRLGPGHILGKRVLIIDAKDNDGYITQEEDTPTLSDRRKQRENSMYNMLWWMCNHDKKHVYIDVTS